ncbi:unnamed protein product [Spodoptera exigua]|nr:unnamed protein product [Spodoptera exigua]
MGRSQELLNAAREGDKRTVEKILGQITNISGPFTSFKNILQVGKPRGVELPVPVTEQVSKLEKPEEPICLRRGAGVNVQDDNGYTPLHQACLNGHREIVRVLLSVGANPGIVDKKGATPLHLAAFNGDTDVCWMLLAHNPPVNIDQLTSDHETALLIAAQFGFVNVVAQLITRGADVTIKNNNDESALDLAAQYGRLAVVQHLLQVRPQLVDQYRYPACRNVIFTSTPLHRASKNGRKDVVTALIDAGMDPNVRTHSGTPLHEAARFGKPSVVRILLNKGADLHAQDSSRKTVYDLLAEYPEEATRKVRKVIREYENLMGNFDSDKELPPFPVQDYSPDAVMTPTETQKNTNNIDSPLSPSSSSLTKSHPQSFVKKLASKCLGLKAKFNSAPNISNNPAEVDVKSKQSEQKSNSNTMLIGNSKFFKMLSKKEESGEIVCNDEFDTISLDRLGTLNRDSVVNRSNRSCPGFKTSLPNISENNELSDSQESVAESIVITEIDYSNSSKKDVKVNEAVNNTLKLNIFEPRDVNDRKSVASVISAESTQLVNECYESYEFSKTGSGRSIKKLSLPRPPPRLNVASSSSNENIYENVVMEVKTIPKPAARIHVPVKPLDEVQRKNLYENISVIQERKQPEPMKRTFVPKKPSSDGFDDKSSTRSRSSTLSSDSMIDESNLEDILLSEKSKSFRHRKTSPYSTAKSQISRTQSTASDSSDLTEASALENVDCSYEVEEKPLYLSMTGTLPNKKTDKTGDKKVLFRHKTFTNIEVDRNSVKVRDLPQWNNTFLKETLAHYHIRGTGHCIYNAPTVQEFIYIFNRETLYSDVPPFTKVPNDKRDSYFETAICFCRPRPPKFHSSAEDLLDKNTQSEDGQVIIDLEALKNRNEIVSSSFKCYCDSGTCTLHSNRRESPVDLVVKFSAIKRSISTPDITLESSPYSTTNKLTLPKNKSVPNNLEDPYAVVSLILSKTLQKLYH